MEIRMVNVRLKRYSMIIQTHKSQLITEERAQTYAGHHREASISNVLGQLELHTVAFEDLADSRDLLGGLVRVAEQELLDRSVHELGQFGQNFLIHFLAKSGVQGNDRIAVFVDCVIQKLRKREREQESKLRFKFL